MKGFFITNVENEYAAKVARKHLVATRDFNNFRCEIFEAVKPENAFPFLESKGIKFLDGRRQPQEFKDRNKLRQYNARPGIAGCFASHFQLWNKCVELNEPIGVFEYDARQVRVFPTSLPFTEFLYLSAFRNHDGKDPNNYHEGDRPRGIYDYTGYHSWGYPNVISGSHAYVIKPVAAMKLIDAAFECGWFPVDRFFSSQIVKTLYKQTITPAVFKVKESKGLSYGESPWVAEQNPTV